MMTREAQIAAAGGSIHEHRKTTRKMRWWYESLADYMIANPRATQNEIAAHFQRGVSTISTIVNSDAFIAYFRQRRDRHATVIDASVRSKLMHVADRSLDLMLETLEKKGPSIPLEQLQRTTESTLKALGYGADRAPQTNVTVNNNTTTVPVAVSLEDLEAARGALRRSQVQELPQVRTIEHVAEEREVE